VILRSSSKLVSGYALAMRGPHSGDWRSRGTTEKARELDLSNLTSKSRSRLLCDTECFGRLIVYCFQIDVLLGKVTSCGCLV
jgi:hypothetical protein